jgi:hypothetical protein
MADATVGLVVTQDETLTPSYAALNGGGYVLDLAGNVAIKASPTPISGVNIVVSGSVSEADIRSGVAQWLAQRGVADGRGAAGGPGEGAVYNVTTTPVAGNDAANGTAFAAGTWTAS